MRDPVAREFLLAFWKIHILHHAGEDGMYGHWMLEELRRHGYRLSPGTLYPVLSRMRQRGWLRVQAAGPSNMRVYRLTPAGRRVLERLRGALEELRSEVVAPRGRRAKRKERGSRGH
jgi:DNA-binding PadR family transcriptional regulator